mmetsp:Transcript_38853/g.97908  ORF Transcript_38853/g.97908 Transcript_38853/m.97908 type:complete len:237 (+) Transcript_38853:329-1039(+)
MLTTKKIDSQKHVVQSIPKTFRFELDEGGICNYLSGVWKRSVEWRDFGQNYGFIKCTNTFIHMDKYQHPMRTDPGIRHMKWNFAGSIHRKDILYSYIIKFAYKPHTRDEVLEWKYSGQDCTGIYNASSSSLVTNYFLERSTMTVTYYIMDKDSMAVCCTEVDNLKRPTVQFGNMFRLNLELYRENNTESRGGSGFNTAARNPSAFENQHPQISASGPLGIKKSKEVSPKPTPASSM